MGQSLRILIANIILTGRTGTEIVVRDLALGFQALGHRPMIYTSRCGEIAQEIAAQGIPVVDNLEQLPEPPDIVHGNHYVETAQALSHFPTVQGIFVCHDRTGWHGAPPIMAQIKRYVAVDENCRERLSLELGQPMTSIQVIHNAVDVRRFLRRAALPERPQRVLIFSNNADKYSHVPAITAACQRLGLPVDIIGERNGNQTEAPEQILGQYDLIFGKARCALEAMITGTAVVLCDAIGLGPMVTMDTVDKLRQWNFGARLLTYPLDPDQIVQQIKRYNATDATLVSQHLRQEASLDRALERYLSLYREVLDDSPLEVHPAPFELEPITRRLSLLIQELYNDLHKLYSDKVEITHILQASDAWATSLNQAVQTQVAQLDHLRTENAKLYEDNQALLRQFQASDAWATSLNQTIQMQTGQLDHLRAELRRLSGNDVENK